MIARRSPAAKVSAPPPAVAKVLEILGAGVKRQQSFEQPVLDCERDHRPARGVSAREVAVLEEVV